MHEVRVTVPAGKGADVARMALAVGIGHVLVYSVYAHGPERVKDTVSAETSTPKANRFLEALFKSGHLDPLECSVSTRELRAIWSREPTAEITRPMEEPVLDVIDDLWQLSHITPSYMGRAVAAALLMAYAMLTDDAAAIVVAALFLPFLSQTVATSFGILVKDWALARHGASALAVSTLLSVASGAAVAAITGGSFQSGVFRSPLANLGISCVVGIAAGLSIADDTGRRYMIGVAAAVQYAVYPVWFGIALVLGFPDWQTTLTRVGVFVMNVAVIGGAAVLVHKFMRLDAGV